MKYILVLLLFVGCQQKKPVVPTLTFSHFGDTTRIVATGVKVDLRGIDRGFIWYEDTILLPPTIIHDTIIVQKNTNIDRVNTITIN